MLLPTFVDGNCRLGACFHANIAAMEAGHLTDEFLVRVSEPLRSVLAAQDDLHGLLVERSSSARAKWPSIKLGDQRFWAYVAARLPESGDADTLGRLCTDDLYAACACVAGSDSAILAVEEKIFASVDNAIANICKTRAHMDEVKQRLRERLFVAPPGETPRIATYSGRGNLNRWISVSAVRLALNMVQSNKKDVRLSDAALPAAVDDVELDHMRDQYSQQFKEAFARAIKDLDPRERNLLRLQVIDGLSIDAVGAAYSIHRATAARWLQAARDHLAKATKDHLRMELRIDRDELESIMRLVRSRLDLSLHRHLTTDPVDDA